ncbi:MAG: phosphoribosyltransferase family protein [Acidimicrobiales bacterium]
MFLPIRCAVCGRAGVSPCPVCLAEMRRAPGLATPPGLDRCHALLSFDGPARDLVARLKYRNARGALGWLAGAMADLVRPTGADLVTWAPTSPGRRRQRGFDQAELLARRVAGELGRPCPPLLRRLGGPPQTGLSQVDRWRGPRLVSHSSIHLTDAHTVLVVDDVITSGASMSAAARTLRQAGAGHVIGLAAARTPRPGLRRRAG